MNLQAFAEQYRLKIRSGEGEDEKIIPGKYGHIYQDGKRMAVLFMPDPNAERPPRPKRWTAHRKAILKAGATIKLDCEDEGIAFFDPESKEQARLAIKIAGIKRKRLLTPEQHEKSLEVLAAARRKIPKRSA